MSDQLDDIEGKIDRVLEALEQPSIFPAWKLIDGVGPVTKGIQLRQPLYIVSNPSNYFGVRLVGIDTNSFEMRWEFNGDVSSPRIIKVVGP